MAMITAHHAKYFAHALTRRCPSDSVQILAVSLADEVGLGKTIEAGILLPQRWAERVERLVFVALTRAAKWAYLSTGLGETLPLIEHCLPLEQTRQHTVRRGDQSGPRTANPSAPPPRDSNNNLDFL